MGARANNERVLVLFEGRDTAGKGGTIQRMREHLNPRFACHVALQAPTDVERGQWYFQRYVEQLPTHGEIAFFDRSWYNRAGVERVMGFATDEQIERFFEQVVPFEEFLVNDGIHLVKVWLSVAQEEQVKRLDSRRSDPLKQWKLSPLDEQAPAKWEDYTLATIDTFRRTDSDHAPWWFVNNNTKRVGRVNVIRHVLSQLPYAGKDGDVVKAPRRHRRHPRASSSPRWNRVVDRPAGCLGDRVACCRGRSPRRDVLNDDPSDRRRTRHASPRRVRCGRVRRGRSMPGGGVRMGRRRALVLPLVVMAIVFAMTGCGAGSRRIRHARSTGRRHHHGRFVRLRRECAARRGLQPGPRGARLPRAARVRSSGRASSSRRHSPRDLIEFLPEYAGTALQFVSLDVDAPAADVDARRIVTWCAHSMPTTSRRSPRHRRRTRTRSWCAARRPSGTSLQRISDLTKVASQLTFGGPPECPSRPSASRGLEDVYGLKFKEFIPLDVGGPLTREALDGDVVDVALLFTTDPAIADRDLVALEDDRGLQPAENVTPLVRSAVVERLGPDLARAVDAVSRKLTTESLRDLNAQVAVDGSDPARVAGEWLERAGLT